MSILSIVATAVLGARIVTRFLRPEFNYFTHFFPTHLPDRLASVGVLLGHRPVPCCPVLGVCEEVSKRAGTPFSYVDIPMCHSRANRGCRRATQSVSVHIRLYVDLSGLRSFALPVPSSAHTNERVIRILVPMRSRSWQALLFHLSVAPSSDL